MSEKSDTEFGIEEAVALAIADALGEGTFYNSPGYMMAARAAIQAMDKSPRRAPTLLNEPIGLNWTLSEDAKKHLDEIEKFTVRSGDPRLKDFFR